MKEKIMSLAEAWILVLICIDFGDTSTIKNVFRVDTRYSTPQILSKKLQPAIHPFQLSSCGYPAETLSLVSENSSDSCCRVVEKNKSNLTSPLHTVSSHVSIGQLK